MSDTTALDGTLTPAALAMKPGNPSVPDPPLMQPAAVPTKIKDGNERMARFTLEDGSTLSVYIRMVNLRRRIGELGPDGNPIYDFEMQTRCAYKPKD